MDQPNHATGELANESMRSPITMRNHVASERASEPVHPCRSGITRYGYMGVGGGGRREPL